MRARHCPACLAAYRLDLWCCPRDGASLVVGKDPLLGALLGDRYMVESVIGAGGMGRVYKVHHVSLQKTFALKVIFGDLAMDPRMAARFEREARAASRLDHPNIVSTVDFAATPEGLLYLVMEYLEGESLGGMLGQGPLTPGRAMRYFRQIMEGLAHAHGRGLVHRDLKPDNILLVPRELGDARVKIVDFGLAHLQTGDEAGTTDRITRAGEIFGTPEYMAPEQVRGGEVIPQTDLYSAGIMLFQMLEGKPPFASKNPNDILVKQCTMAAPALKQQADLLPDSLKILIARLLAKNGGERPRSAISVLKELATFEGFIPGTLTPTPQPSGVDKSTPTDTRAMAKPLQPTWNERMTPSRWVAVTGGVAAAILFGAFLLWWGTFSSGSSAPRAESPALEPVRPSEQTVVAKRPVQPAATDASTEAATTEDDTGEVTLEKPQRGGDASVALTTPSDNRAGLVLGGSLGRRSARRQILQKGNRLLSRHGITRPDLSLDAKLNDRWTDLTHAANSGDANSELRRLETSLEQFAYPRGALKKKIERVDRRIGELKRKRSAIELRNRLDSQMGKLVHYLGSKQSRRAMWLEIARIERDATKLHPR